jgi:hypothetical protein
MGNERAGYFIHDWQELGNQVSRIIVGGPRYQAIKASQAADLGDRLLTGAIPTRKPHGSMGSVANTKKRNLKNRTANRFTASHILSFALPSFRLTASHRASANIMI